MAKPIQDDGGESPTFFGMRPPKIMFWAVVAAAVAALVLVLAGSHRGGVSMITPGKKPTMLSPAALNDAVRDLRYLGRPQLSAATRQVEANG